MFNSKVFVAEFIGTFALVFIGAGAGVVGSGGLVGVALAHGFVIAVFVYIYGYISGAHFNPAVTFGLALNGTVKWGQAVWYWVAQFVSAVVAAFLLRLVVASVSGLEGGATVGSLSDPQPYAALIVEIILTFFLVHVILNAAVAGKAGSFAGLVIGLTLVFAILAGGPLTGASLNPARSLGPALFTKAMNKETLDAANPFFYLIYFAGPLVGSVLAVGLFRFLNDGEDESAKKPPKKK